MNGKLEDAVDRMPFLFLGLDLPAAPLYKDVMEQNIIPQVGSGALCCMGMHWCRMTAESLQSRFEVFS